MGGSPQSSEMGRGRGTGRRGIPQMGKDDADGGGRGTQRSQGASADFANGEVGMGIGRRGSPQMGKMTQMGEGEGHREVRGRPLISPMGKSEWGLAEGGVRRWGKMTLMGEGEGHREVRGRPLISPMGKAEWGMVGGASADGQDDADREAKSADSGHPLSLTLPSASIIPHLRIPLPLSPPSPGMGWGVSFGGKEIPKWLCGEGRVCEGRSSLRSVAQPGRALGLGPRRRRFKSCRSDHSLFFPVSI